MKPILTGNIAQCSILAIALLPCVPVTAQGTSGSGHFLWLDVATAATGDVVLMASNYTNTTGSPIPGWAVAVTHDQNELSLLSAVNGVTTQTVKAGSPPDFSQFNTVLQGWSHGVVICFLGCSPLPPGSNYQLEVASYEVLISTGELAEVCYCNCIGTPPVSTVVIVAGQSVVPSQQCGSVEVPQDTFVRGDCNADGAFNVADAVAGLISLFVPGSTPVVCADACDANDDGGFNIADAVALLNALFVPFSPPIPAPATACGIDPTDDGLDCDSFPSC